MQVLSRKLEVPLSSLQENASNPLRRLLADTPLPLLGLAFCRAWSQWAVASMDALDSGASFLTCRPFYDFACLAAALVLASVAPKIGELFRHDRLLLAASLTMCLIPLLSVFAPVSPGGMLGYAGAAVGGVGFFIMSAAWACLYVRYGSLRAVMLFCLARVLSEGIIFMYAGFNEAYLAGALALSPLVSYLCLRHSVNLLDGAMRQAETDGSRPFPWKPAAFMLVYAFAYAVSCPASGTAFLAYPATACTAVPPIVFLACSLYLSGRFNFGSFYLIACPTMMAAILLPAAFGASSGQFAKACLEISFSTAVLTEFLMVAELSSRLKIQPLWLFCIVRAFRYAGLLLGWLFVRTTGGLGEAACTSVVLIICVVVVSFMLISEHGGNANWGIFPKNVAAPYMGETPDSRICEVGSTFGLSKREVEVLGLLAEGATPGSIAIKLSLAEGTVKAHVQHIYQKTDCHSRKDLMALVHGGR